MTAFSEYADKRIYMFDMTIKMKKGCIDSNKSLKHMPLTIFLTLVFVWYFQKSKHQPEQYALVSCGDYNS